MCANGIGVATFHHLTQAVKNTQTVDSPDRKQDRSRLALGVALALGLIVRAVLLWNTTALQPRVVDEQHFTQLARNLVAGNGFSWSEGQPTSIRPPLYPAMVASVWSIAGVDGFQIIRLLQMALALLTAALVYQIGARVYNSKVGRYAAAVFWLYPSLLFFNFLILTETLFTFLLIAHVLLGIALLQRPRMTTAAFCGLTLGLAALTRSVVFPALLVLCPLLFVALEAPVRRKAALVGLIVAGYLAVVAPWAVRNTRLQHTLTIIDTMGGRNLRMGNYTYTPTDRMWNAVALTGPESWSADLPRTSGLSSMTEGEIDRWAQGKAVTYILQHPWITIRRSVTKFADFWGLEREFIAGVQQGLYAPPAWVAGLGAALITLAYVLVVVSGAAGIWLAPPRDLRPHLVMLLPILLITGLHTITFGHSRYHLPLMPLFCVYGAALVVERPSRAFRAIDVKPMLAAAASIVVLIGIWIEQVAIVDLTRIQSWLDHVR